MSKKILENDEISRWLYSPRDFSNIGLTKLDLKHTLHFSTTHQRKESVNCKRFTSNYPTELHIKGEDKASKDNIKRPPEKALEYIGFSKATAKDVHAINVENYFFKISHTPINGQYEHCDLAMICPEIPHKGIIDHIKNRLYSLLEFGGIIKKS